MRCVCAVTLNANRQVTGVLRGFDQFMNLVLDSTVDEKLKQDIGMVVSPTLGSSMVQQRQTHAWVAASRRIACHHWSHVVNGHWRSPCNAFLLGPGSGLHCVIACDVVGSWLATGCQADKKSVWGGGVLLVGETCLVIGQA